MALDWNVIFGTIFLKVGEHNATGILQNVCLHYSCHC